VDGQCCHSLVENLAICKGFQPSLLFVTLNIKRTDPPVASQCSVELNLPALQPLRRMITS
jgi:hypothetical protein